MSYPIVTLQKGKEANAVYRHPWIFSGALVKRPSEEEVAHGAIVRVADGAGRVLGTGSYSAKSSIAVRLFTFGETEVTINAAWLATKFREAQSRRELLGFGAGTDTTGYRMIFGEADGVPGLVVDRYDDVLVVQSSTATMDALMPEVITALVEVCSPRSIMERSDLAVRKEEALRDRTGMLYGEVASVVSFKENGLSFEADVSNGQKTGFFLDQKELRQAIGRFAKDHNVLNLFSYTGAAGVAAIKGGAKLVTNVDSSADALAAANRHAELNGIAPEHFLPVESDVFQFLSAAAAKGERFDMIVLDPPALIKSQRDTEEGKKAYHFLNRAALRLVADGGLFVTSSCSHFMTEDDLAFTLRRASVQSNVTIDVLAVVRQAADHPSSVYFPESAYLKSFICRVRATGGTPHVAKF